MPSNYWSCSKFADWIRGTPKPLSGTAKEWNAWEKSARKRRFRYWLAEEGLDWVQMVISWPKNSLNALRHYCNNRWVHKTHALTSQLPPGKWHDFDTRMLHAAFDSLIDFVEVELAWCGYCQSDEANKKYCKRGSRSIRILPWRSPEAGLEHLHWAASLRQDEDWVDKSHPDFGKPTQQALAATETIALYKWWKEVRPKRPDPMDAGGWNRYFDEQHKNGRLSDEVWPDIENKTEEEKAREREILATCHKIESAQEEEDTEMLIRLVKLRQSLWI